MRTDIMVDIETLGKGSGATIFQISAMSFDINSGKIHEEFNQIADVTKNKNFNVDGSTLKWWLNENALLLRDLLNKGDHSSEEMLCEFYKWIVLQGNNVYLWGNGILFDNKMIQEQFEGLGLKYPIFYRNDRDVRTIVDLAGAKLGLSEKELKDKYKDESLVAHDAYDDVKYQIQLVVGCYNELIK